MGETFEKEVGNGVLKIGGHGSQASWGYVAEPKLNRDGDPIFEVCSIITPNI